MVDFCMVEFAIYYLGNFKITAILKPFETIII